MPHRVRLTLRDSADALDLEVDPRRTPRIGDRIEVATPRGAVTARIVAISTHPMRNPEAPPIDVVYAREI